MLKQISKLLHKSYPQNFIVRKPVYGTIFYGLFIFLFLILYKPLNVRASLNNNLIVTMFMYQLFTSVLVFASAIIIKRTSCFSKDKRWTFSKELKSVFIILAVSGISIYFLGFLFEEPANRWNFSTFFDAFFRAILIGIIPLMFLTLSNVRHLYVTEVVQEFKTDGHIPHQETQEDQIHIISQLKKEELNFYPHQFIYAESEGNYVVFHLHESEKQKKVVIRNSISNIEQQLSGIPFLTRTHRAFIVNLKKVISKKGNSLGYRLKFSGTDDEIPVSRQNTQTFDALIRQFR